MLGAQPALGCLLSETLLPKLRCPGWKLAGFILGHVREKLKRLVCCYLVLCVLFAGAIAMHPALHLLVEHAGQGSAHTHLTAISFPLLLDHVRAAQNAYHRLVITRQAAKE